MPLETIGQNKSNYYEEKYSLAQVFDENPIRSKIIVTFVDPTSQISMGWVIAYNKTDQLEMLVLVQKSLMNQNG